MKDNKTWEGVHMFENTLPETIQEQEYKEYKCTFPLNQGCRPCTVLYCTVQKNNDRLNFSKVHFISSVYFFGRSIVESRLFKKLAP